MRRYGLSRIGTGIILMTLGAASGGCDTITALTSLLESMNGHPAPQITFVLPAQASTVAPGATVSIQWADLATDVGTIVKIEADRLDSADVVQETIVLADHRDAIADGASDKVDFDTTGRTPGRYRFRATITSPDGQFDTATAIGIVTLQ